MEQSSQVLNILLGVFSLLAIISGFLIKDYQIQFWLIGVALLVFVILRYYIIENKNQLNFLLIKFKKIEESLNIYNRLNKLELKMAKTKKGEMNLIDLIKIVLAILLIIIFYNAIKSLL